MSSNRELIGVPQPAHRWRLGKAQARAYAEATGDENPRYRTAPPCAPPMALVIGTVGLGLRGLLENEDFIASRERFLKLVHTEEDIRWHAPLPLETPLELTTTVLDIDDRIVGEFLSFETRVTREDGTEVATSRTTALVREPKPMEQRVAGTRKPAEEPVAVAAPAGEVLSANWSVSPDQAARYADASGDRNPIHLDELTARRAGLDGPILHGLCTMAFAQRVVVDRAAGGDPNRLKRLRVRFSRPVYFGDTLTCVLQPVAINGHYRLTVHNQNGVPVLKDGIAEVQD